MPQLLSDDEVIERIFHHIDNKSTDSGDQVWREPVESYLSEERFQAEIELLRQLPVPFCPSAALPKAGSYVARTAALTPLLVVRGDDGVVRAFRNACRHRGMPVAEGSGCARAFNCPYHAWSYGLDGQLKFIPGADGFPDLDKAGHGLVPVKAEEKHGVVFITQDEAVSTAAMDAMPQFLYPEQQLFDTVEISDEANWKLLCETSMEGYHIKALHNRTFFPYGFDNLNIVETYGPNSRITFPFRRIEKLRTVPPAERRIDGMVTYAYQLFPNAHVSVLSNHSLFIVVEPISPSESKWIFYRLSNRGGNGKLSAEQLDEAKRDARFVKDTGLDEDRHAARAIQAGLQSRANSDFTFGRYETAIIHFHSNLQALLPKVA
ncbi:MAG: aromatic ring-hydroxylating dioxygenase subunit alpha [Rhodospirillaceae bacterium]|jgi:phenylpropionate dioxygenase-like ring-hydroxylating dioxygenase large terminal subunit|nr:aromatic ring-hydroxylating dioxygenase subunit alpha [Rhodospirillaceae bacterium]MBT3492302.1 aromatic ring-hydroxylating dioxygenase subunit alpha [Rhodospirillaceae bacterium]MBT3782343.1 aromatic ring-hydroxylating dioxygenase subunit alpha [Rhodospirillaceae bacterium]MBT3975157.1 aromatic ring-hydroxylating dioxygenase subunit alpha [Rhodospirillaceae bacterium]MBT4166839.1 aromatic ring-hydroxylating dioxygenase subunit alpha [Rhodospirillaceae bacterium]